MQSHDVSTYLTEIVDFIPRIGHCPQNALRTFGGLPAGHSAGHSP